MLRFIGRALQLFFLLMCGVASHRILENPADAVSVGVNLLIVFGLAWLALQDGVFVERDRDAEGKGDPEGGAEADPDSGDRTWHGGGH